MLAATLLVPRSALAQATPALATGPAPSRTWFAMGGAPRGWSGPSRQGTELISFGLELAHQRGAQVFTLRLSSVAPDVPYHDGDEVYDELDVLYGRALVGLPFHAAASIGLSGIRACEELPDSCSYGVGLPLVAEAVMRPFPIVGFGIQAFGNINTAASFGGVSFVVHVGWMPTR